MLRLGIVGIGKIANDYISLIAENDVQEIEIAALCSRNTAHVREVAEQYGLKSVVFSDYTAMLHSGQIDGVLFLSVGKDALNGFLAFGVKRLVFRRMPEWSKGADCKSVGDRLRWFKSNFSHHFSYFL